MQSVRALTRLAPAAALACAACGLVFDLRALGPGTDDTQADGGVTDGAPDGSLLGDGAADGSVHGADANGEAAATEAGEAGSACPSSHGPALVSAGGVCIDRTQVTVSDYGAFLTATRNAPPLASPCDWVTSLTPDDWAAQSKTPRHPVVTVTWCHASTYCKWAGKRLCGRVGGGPVLLADAGVDPATNQWYRACSRAGVLAYPYGTTPLAGACPAYPVVDDVGTHPSCEGGYPGLFDMTANVAEWTDGCDNQGGTNHSIDACTAMGSSSTSGGRACADATDLSRHWADPSIGFRCCGP